MGNFNKWIAPILDAHWWQTWIKPFYIFAAGFDRVLWVDADCTFHRDPSPLFDRLDEGPVLIADGTPADTRNRPRLYRHLSLPRGVDVENARLNAGVLGFCRIRDRALLDSWAWGIQWAAQQPSARRSVSYADQGILQWAVAYHGMADQIDQNRQWNTPCNHEAPMLPLTEGQCLLDRISENHPHAGIVHWYGVYKLTGRLTEQLVRQFI